MERVSRPPERARARRRPAAPAGAGRLARSRRADINLEEALAFEALLLDLSARFVSLAAHDIDQEITRALQRLVEFLGISRANLFQPAGSRDTYALTHSWSAPGQKQAPGFPVSEIPWIAERIMSGRPHWFSRLEDLPEEAAREKELLAREGVRSGLAIPLSVGGAIVGALSFDSLQTERSWPDPLIQRLRLVGEIFANALKRKEMDEALAERLQFEQLLLEISARFVNLPASEIDREIESGLRRVVEFLDVDRGSLFQTGDQKSGYGLTHAWARAGAPRTVAHLEREIAWVAQRLLGGKPVFFSDPEQLPEDASRLKRLVLREGIRSAVAIPLSIGGEVVGGLSFDSLRTERTWPETLIQRLRLLGEVFANALIRARNELELRGAFSEIDRLREQLRADCDYLQEEIKLEHNYEEFVGRSNALRYVLFKVEQIAPTDATVLVLGETGTGKELVARAIHNASSRKGRPLVKVNCAALPSNLLESELFGHEKGAFSGADARRLGRFEIANGTTLLLDEIGELPLEAQAKLLRVLQEGEFERLGSSSTLKVDVRVLACSNRDLEAEVQRGRFREDLWYRLSLFPVTVPPLRQRKEDIPLLVRWFVGRFASKYGKSVPQIPSSVLKALQEYPWPGNVRELQNVIERAVIRTQGPALQLLDFPATAPAPRRGPRPRSLAGAEREHIIGVLQETNWKIDGANGAARALDLNPSTLRFRMRKLGIRRSSSPL
ncbi:MAG: sigma 54-interacting transcriptional regulator [bacterium]